MCYISYSCKIYLLPKLSLAKGFSLKKCLILWVQQLWLHSGISCRGIVPWAAPLITASPVTTSDFVVLGLFKMFTLILMNSRRGHGITHCTSQRKWATRQCVPLCCRQWAVLSSCSTSTVTAWMWRNAVVCCSTSTSTHLTRLWTRPLSTSPPSSGRPGSSRCL